MKTIYNAILQNLSAEVPEIRFIELNTGQLEDPAGSYVTPFPCVLIQFSEIVWAGIGGGIVAGDATITVKVAFQIWEDINNITPEEIYYNGIERLEIVNRVFACLQNMTGDNFNELQVTGTNDETRPNIVIFTETYITHVRRNQAREKRETTIPPIKMNINKTVNPRRS